nr:MBL fold metallo-hydrolase [Bacillus subtilis]WEZ51758.1 MBL fold metallo-hydrolase [Bacillus subtilis]
MKVTYHGHSVITVETKDHHIIFDPFLTGNSLTDIKPEDVKADVILLTHGHNDHVGDTEQIAKQNNALVIAPNEPRCVLRLERLECSSNAYWRLPPVRFWKSEAHTGLSWISHHR